MAKGALWKVVILAEMAYFNNITMFLIYTDIDKATVT